MKPAALLNMAMRGTTVVALVIAAVDTDVAQRANTSRYMKGLTEIEASVPRDGGEGGK